MPKILFVVYGYIFLQMLVVWLLYKISRNPSIVDVAWPIGLMVSGLIYIYFNSHINWRNEIISVLLIVWSLRLAIYLWLTRIKKGHIDKRYTYLSNEWKINKSAGFFFNYQLQGLFIFLISNVFYFISKVTYLSLSDLILFVLIFISILCESISDIQLHQFKKYNSGQVCNIGFWNYSRHPNYFFDWLTWCCFALLGLSGGISFLGLISPLFLYIIFIKITGPITEQASIKSRGQKYINYQKTTSMFFPWIKKKTNEI